MARPSRLLAALSALAVTAACTVPSEGRLYGVSEASADLQRDALLQCRDQLGYAGRVVALDSQFQARRYEENLYRLRVVPNDALDAGAAARINACAEQRLRAQFGTGRPMVGPGDVTGYAPAAAALQPAQSLVRTPAPVATGPICPAHASVLYRGSLYCTGR